MTEQTPTPARLEAFSDGVIAVIITVMVLEIKVPHADGFEGIVTLVPALAIYLLSFAFTGIYCLNHQHLLRRTKLAGHGTQVANLGFLFCLSLLPLSTAYMVEKETSGFAVGVYASLLFVIALSFMWLRLAIHSNLRRRNALTTDDQLGLRNHLVSLGLYAASAIAAIRYPRVALVAIAALTFIWTLPNVSFSQFRQQHERSE